MNSTADRREPLKVALVGAGVVGLTCALALLQKGVSVEVFEAAAQFGEIGAGIGIGPNAARVLRRLGVLDEVCTRCNEPGLNMGEFRFLSAEGDHQLLYSYPLTEGGLGNGLGAYRPAFLDALVKYLPPNITHFHKRCISIVPSTTSPTGKVLNFSDGSSYEADVVIGADGIKSAIRPMVADSTNTLPVFSNTICFRGLIPMTEARAAGFTTEFNGHPICFASRNKHLIVFGMNGNTTINVVAFAADYTNPIGSASLPPDEAWVKSVPQEEMLKVYEGCGPEVAALLRCIKTPSKWSIHVVHPHLESFVKGRVALIGDAAHGMLPHLGSGAGQGIEDAYILGQLLGHPQTHASNVEAVLKAYDRWARPRARMVWEGSYRAGKIYDGCGEHGFSPEGVTKDIGTQWAPVWFHDVDDDIHNAVDELRAEGAFPSE
ncbi:FAD/NAD(P)-binding domain-containing protein [Daedalea quercina L-15889]|uniref:FAD/NAD(P)-binding domain-containing protein n=1 Tax=Daedalea quercina L-15889 TaxID=1314783 RepID=A0A165UIA6_9APHY|nr:FAD/NAD(P)-binding domain-containing protein [Daedalea quercina L-15889]